VNVGENISVNATSNMVDTSSDMIATRDKTNSPNNITIPTTNGIAQDEELEARAHHVIELEYVGCTGVCYSDFSGIDYPTVFDMATRYPFSVHGKNVQQTFCKTNFIPKISWSVDSNGRFRDLHCKGVVARDKNNEEDVAATTVNGNVACDKCVGLKYNCLYVCCFCNLTFQPETYAMYSNIKNETKHRNVLSSAPHYVRFV